MREYKYNAEKPKKGQRGRKCNLIHGSEVWGGTRRVSWKNQWEKIYNTERGRRKDTICRDWEVKKLNKEIKILNSKGKCLGEFDEIDLQNKIFYEDKTTKGLNVINPRTGLPSQIPQEFTDKQIYTKTKNRINNLANSAGTREAKTNIFDNVPYISELQSIKKFVFRLDGDSPDLINAVQDSIKKLELEFSDYTFEATFRNH